MIETVLRDSLQVRKGETAFPSGHSASLVPSLHGWFDGGAGLFPAPIPVGHYALVGDNTIRSTSRRCLGRVGMAEVSFIHCPAGKLSQEKTFSSLCKILGKDTGFSWSELSDGLGSYGIALDCQPFGHIHSPTFTIWRCQFDYYQ